MGLKILLSVEKQEITQNATLCCCKSNTKKYLKEEPILFILILKNNNNYRRFKNRKRDVFMFFFFFFFFFFFLFFLKKKNPCSSFERFLLGFYQQDSGKPLSKNAIKRGKHIRRKFIFRTNLYQIRECAPALFV